MNWSRSKFVKSSLAWGLIIVVNVHALAQTSSQPALWKKTPAAEHHSSIVKIILPSGVGTGVVVFVDKGKPNQDGFLGYCLTAYHVVKEDKDHGNIRVEFRDGRRARGGKVMAFDEANDLALVLIWVQSSISPVQIASQPVAADSALEFVGLGGGVAMECCLRHFSGVAAATTNQNTIYSDVVLLPGDSGGGVFNQKNELVGIISGGWFWFQIQSESVAAESVRNATWPGRASNLVPIGKLIMNQFETTEVRLVESPELNAIPIAGPIK